MLAEEILQDAGFILNETYRELRFLEPPGETYAVYIDTMTVRGPDDLNAVEFHETNIELYEYAPDPDAEARIEAQLDAHGQPYIKQARYWISEEQLYQIIYEFNYTIKRKEF